MAEWQDGKLQGCRLRDGSAGNRWIKGLKIERLQIAGLQGGRMAGLTS
jgi:hypothetical protein